MFLPLSSTVPAFAEGQPPGGNISDPIVRAVDIAKPSVVRIITETSGRLTVHFSPTMDVTFPQGNADAYQVALSGSGTFITGHGDILTADHVVNPPDQVLQDTAAQDVAIYINQHPELGFGQVTANAVDQALVTKQLRSNANFINKKSEVLLSTDYTGPLRADKIDNIPPEIHAPVDQIKKESAVDQKDLAIVHTNLGMETPNVQLGDSSTVQQQDLLTIIGFPGNGDVSTRPTDFLTSSVNKINVSSIKTTDNGASVIQVGGNVEHGDSGGPALDSSGKIVGVVSFGVGGDNAGGNTSFLQTSNGAHDLVQSLNLDTTPGAFQKLWNQSFEDYASTAPGHWHKAQQGFEQLATRYPEFKAVTNYMNYARDMAKNEQDPANPLSGISSSSGSGLPLVLTLVGVIVLLLGSLLVVVVLMRRKAPAVAPASGVGMMNGSTPMPYNHPMMNGNTPMPHGNSMVAFGGTPPPQPVQQMSFGQPMAPGPVGQPVQQLPFGQPFSPSAPTLPAGAGQAPSATPSGQSFPGVSRLQPAPGQQPSTPGLQDNALLRAWPCGHMNRQNARFCSVCGDPAPFPPTA